jgi:opacity protein-like surface antigen
MLKKKKWCYWASIILFVAILFPVSAMGKDAGMSFSLYGQVSPFLSGDAGSGPGAPEYTDVFDPGTSVGAELSWGIVDFFSLIAGAGYEHYNGDKNAGISFDDLKVVPVYIGAKLPICNNSSGLLPYLRTDIGAAYLSSVDVSFETLSGKYWDSSWVFLFDVGGGVEYRFDQWGLSLDVRLRYLQKPEPAMGDASKADSSLTLPVGVGIHYHF